MTALCPGPVPTEFQARAGIKSMKYPRMLTRSPEQVAAEGYAGLEQNRRVVVPEFPNKLITTLVGLVPRRYVLDMAGAEQRPQCSRARGTAENRNSAGEGAPPRV